MDPTRQKPPWSEQGKCDAEKVERVREALQGGGERELEGPEGSGAGQTGGSKASLRKVGFPTGRRVGWFSEARSLLALKLRAALWAVGSRAGLGHVAPAPSGVVWAATQALGSRAWRVPVRLCFPAASRLAVQRHGLDPLWRQQAGGSGSL